MKVSEIHPRQVRNCVNPGHPAASAKIHGVFSEV